jgi:hypothetical protein
VHLNAGDMHCFYPNLFPSTDAAAQAIHRWNGRAALITEVQRLARQLPDSWVRCPGNRTAKAIGPAPATSPVPTSTRRSRRGVARVSGRAGRLDGRPLHSGHRAAASLVGSRGC